MNDSAIHSSTTDYPGPFVSLERAPRSDPDSTTKSIHGKNTYAAERWREGDVFTAGPRVTGRELYRMAGEITSRSPLDWRGASLFFDGQRIAYALSTNDLFEDVGGKEALCTGLLFRGSYDGSWATECELFGYRLVSTSGLLHRDHFGHFCFEKFPFSDGWDEEVTRALRYMEEATGKITGFGEVARLLKKRSVGDSDLNALRGRLLVDLPEQLWEELVICYREGTGHSAWDFLTTSTSLLWNGNGRLPVAEDFRYNQVLTEEVVEAVLEENTRIGRSYALPRSS